MSLLPCPMCGEKISFEVTTCPQCQKRDPFKLRGASPTPVFVIWLVTFLLAVSFLFLLFFPSQVDLLSR